MIQPDSTSLSGHAMTSSEIKVPQIVRTVVVDDSAFARKVVREMLTRSPFIEVVATARDGEEALRLVEELRPDVVTCDLMMPGMNGVEFVRKQMGRAPVPILILSSSPQEADLVLNALQAGAVDFIRKPTALATEQLLEIRSELVEKVKAAARVPASFGAPAPLSPSLAPLVVHPGKLSVGLVAIGISTGGPQALRRILPLFPADFPVPIAVVLHMPVGYTAPFAQKLAEICKIKVVEAQDGTPLLPGTAVLAQAGRHLRVRQTSAGMLVAQLAVQPIENVHRPSVDVLFHSAAEVLHERVLGVVMTGMGDDGTKGAAWIKAAGGTILTESRDTCIIYGMPRAVDEAGLSDASVPLSAIPQAISKRL